MRLEGREVRAQAADVELVDANGPHDVLELPLSEISQGEPVEMVDVVLDVLRGRLRDEHLAAVADGADPRRTVDGQADVALARVQADAHPQLDTVRPLVLGKRPLDLGGSAHGVLGTVEGHEERVALVVDLRSAEVGEDRSQQAMMLFQQRRVALAEGR